MYKYTLQVIWIRFNIIYMSLVAVKPWFHFWYHVLYFKRSLYEKVFHITSTTSYA